MTKGTPRARDVIVFRTNAVHDSHVTVIRRAGKSSAHHSRSSIPEVATTAGNNVIWQPVAASQPVETVQTVHPADLLRAAFPVNSTALLHAEALQQLPQQAPQQSPRPTSGQQPQAGTTSSPRDFRWAPRVSPMWNAGNRNDGYWNPPEPNSQGSGWPQQQTAPHYWQQNYVESERPATSPSPQRRGSFRDTWQSEWPYAYSGQDYQAQQQQQQQYYYGYQGYDAWRPQRTSRRSRNNSRTWENSLMPDAPVAPPAAALMAQQQVQQQQQLIPQVPNERQPSDRRSPAPSRSRGASRRRRPAPGPRQENVPKDPILELMWRDITPEDYDLLLLLDDSVPKKTASEEGLARIKIVKAVDGEDCAICFTAYENEDCKQTPCGHNFHGACIDQWLKQCKDTCPLCNAKV